MDTRKAVKTYHRNLAIVLAIIVAIFAAIPLVVDKPYIINIFRSHLLYVHPVHGMEHSGRHHRPELAGSGRLHGPGVPMCAVWWSQRRA